MSLTSTRTDLAAAIKAAGYSVYSYPSETMVAPAVVVIPGSPYVNVKTNSIATAQFTLTLMVINNNNQAALIALEKMIETLYSKLPNWISLGDFTQPSTLEIGSTEFLTSDITIELQIT